VGPEEGVLGRQETMGRGNTLFLPLSATISLMFGLDPSLRDVSDSESDEGVDHIDTE